MFRFEHITHLYGLLAIPVIVLFFLFMWQLRKRAIRQFASERLLNHLMPNRSNAKHITKLTLILFAFALITIAWANPQWGLRKEKVEKKGIDLFFALDISQSMLAEDVPPNRLERAKRFTQNLIQEFRDNRIGVIFFAGSAYLQAPLTSDYAWAITLTGSADPEQAATQGTAFSNAIELAGRAFPEDNKNHKALLIITDGENHDEAALEAAQTARENGMRIYTIGIGTTSGGFVPIIRNGRVEYKRDRQGNPVRSQLNIDMLQQLATAGGGRYFDLVDNPAVYQRIQESLDEIEKQEMEMQVFDEYESFFQYFLGAGLLLLWIEFFISYRRSRILKNADLFKEI